MNDLEQRVKKFYRSLNTEDYSLFYELPKYAGQMREGAKRLGQQEMSDVYGLIAEETAYYLLRMYKDAGFPMEILDSLVIEFAKDQTTEIDLIAITPNSLYIIECKHRSENIEIQSDGSFNVGGRNESPINQNIGHINRILKKTGYANTIPINRVVNLIYLELNNCRVINPITEFKKELNGAFTGKDNLLSYIHRRETMASGGRIPYIKVAESLRKHDLGIEGKRKHIERLKRKYGDK